MKNPGPETWIGWIAGVGAGVAIVITFAYGQFETKEHAKEKNEEVVARLNRMSHFIEENFKSLGDKTDRILENQRERH